MFDKRHPGKQVINSLDAAENILQFRLHTGCWGRIYRKDIIGNIRFKEGQTFNEDFDFLINIYKFRNPQIALTTDHVYLYRRNPDSVTHTFNRKKFELLEYADKCCRELSIWGG